MLKGFLHCLRGECEDAASVRTKYSAFCPLFNQKNKKVLSWPRSTQKDAENKPEKERVRARRTWSESRSAAVEVRGGWGGGLAGGDVWSVGAGYHEGSVISGRERCIIIQRVKPAESSWEVNQMMEEPMILLFPSSAAPQSTPVKPWVWSGKAGRQRSAARRSAAHRHRNGEHGATFTLKSAHGGGSTQLSIYPSIFNKTMAGYKKINVHH